MILAQIIDSSTGEVSCQLPVSEFFRLYDLFLARVKIDRAISYNDLIKTVLALGLVVKGKGKVQTTDQVQATVEIAIKSGILLPVGQKKAKQGEQLYYLVNGTPF
jgi:hypothetical protein